MSFYSKNKKGTTSVVKKREEGIRSRAQKREGSQEIDARSGQWGNSCPING
jgi:hypothetical protein